MNQLTEKLTTQNVAIGLLTLAVIYLMYVNYNRSCDEKYGSIGTKSQYIPTGFAADAAGEKYVTADADGNLSLSNKLYLNSAANVETNTNLNILNKPVSFEDGNWNDFVTSSNNKPSIFSDNVGRKNLMILGRINPTSTGGDGRRKIGMWDDVEINGNLRSNGTFLTKRTFLANAFTGNPPPPSLVGGTNVNWITVDGLFKMKYSSGQPGPEFTGIMIVPLTPTPTNKRRIWAGSIVYPGSYYPTNRMDWEVDTMITTDTLSTVYNLEKGNRVSAGDYWETTVIANRFLTSSNFSQTNVYKIYCQVLVQLPNNGSPVANSVIFNIEKVNPCNEPLIITT